jgi:putative FmdB family regulatory protein
VPTYAYACTACEHHFEIVQSFTEDSLTECPQCQGRLRKLFNAVGVVFKGSGFYRNDSRTDSRRGSGSGSRKSSHHGSDATSTPASSSESGSSSSDSSSSTSDSSNSATTKTATRSVPKSEGSAA